MATVSLPTSTGYIAVQKAMPPIPPATITAPAETIEAFFAHLK